MKFAGGRQGRIDRSFDVEEPTTLSLSRNVLQSDVFSVKLARYEAYPLLAKRSVWALATFVFKSLHLQSCLFQPLRPPDVTLSGISGSK